MNINTQTILKILLSVVAIFVVFVMIMRLLDNSSEPEPEVAKATISEPKGSSVSTADAEAAFGEWNNMARRLGLPLAKEFTAERRKHLRARLNVAGLDGWREALRGSPAA